MLLERAFFPVGLLACSLVSLVGCRSDGDGDADTTSATTGTGNAGGGGTGGSGSGTGGSGGGLVAGCEGPEATVEGITTGAFGVGAKVAVNGVVAMSQKFLVSKSSTTDNCLWGVFVSAPGLTETAENTGMIILSYGTKAMIPEGGTTAYCPRLGQDPCGDNIPDDVAPGDVLDVVGVIARFPDMPDCQAPDPPTTVGMLQLGQVCKATKTGTATPPTAKLLTGADVTNINSPTNQAFHDKWGGVKIRVENVTADPASATEVVGMYGVVSLTNGLQFGDKIYYRGYSNNFCHEGPLYTAATSGFPDVVFASVEGFHYLNYCTWDIQPNDKCDDLDPKSEDCGTTTVCVPD